ncbi:MAG: hypothetical protein K0S65_4889, partial [Labilithrix sp.]|nr:hypothetical protein [Labilithrix sp.]
MTYAKRALWAVAGVLLAGSAACSSTDDALFTGDRGGDMDAGSSNEPPGAGTETPGAPTATGVLLVHAARFTSFRL